MPFLAPFVPALIGAGASIGGGLLAGRKSSEEKEAAKAAATQAGIQTQASREALGLGRAFAPETVGAFRRGARTTGQAVDYWRRILSGRTGAAAALSPEINQIVQSFRGARQASRALSPRGGGSSALTRRIDEEVIPGQISGLLATARPGAARELSTLGTNLMSSGLTGLGTVGQLFGQGTGAGAPLLQYGPQDRRQQFEAGTAIGANIMDIIKMIPGIGGSPNISHLAGPIQPLPIGMGR